MRRAFVQGTIGQQRLALCQLLRGLEVIHDLIQYWKDKPLYILIDALDECASYRPFLQKLASTDWGNLRVQFILSSRALGDIETPQKRMPVGTIRTINMNKEG